MSKYNEYIMRNGLDYELDSIHEKRYKARYTAKKLKKRKSIWTGEITNTGISTRIIKNKDGRYLLYKRQN